jgi:lysophospholipase L1-like esterase
MTTAYFMADSIGYAGSLPYPTVLSTRMGWTPTVDAIGGTGFLMSAGAGTTFRERVPACIAAAPDIVIVQAGTNDTWYTIAALTTEIGLFFAALRAGLPTAMVYAIAPWTHGTAGIGTSRLDIGRAIAATALGVGGGYIDWLSDPWITGTGYVGNEQGDGNADTFIGADGVHPTSAGAIYVGGRLADTLAGVRHLILSGGNLLTEAGLPMFLESL